MRLLLAQAKNGDKQFWKSKFHVANEKAQHALMRGPVWGGEDFFVFSLFPMCSHQVPQVPKLFPQDLLINTPDLSHMVCAKFNSHENNLKMWAVEEHICF